MNKEQQKQLSKRWKELEKTPDIYSLRQMSKEFGVEITMKWLLLAIRENKLKEQND